MKLNEIKMLREAYMEKLSGLDEVVGLLREHCSDALRFINEPIVRGMTDSDPFIKLHGESGERRSRNTTNHYTVIMNEALPKEFPKRSAAIICGNYANIDHAMEYGTLYAVFPYNTTVVAWTDSDDMFYTPITIAGRTESAHTWNKRFLQMGIPDTSFTDIVEALTKYRDTGMVSGVPYQRWVDDVEDFDRELREAYDEPFDWSLPKSPRWNEDGEPRELWIGGECIGVKMDMLDKVKAALKT